MFPRAFFFPVLKIPEAINDDNALQHVSHSGHEAPPLSALESPWQIFFVELICGKRTESVSGSCWSRFFRPAILRLFVMKRIVSPVNIWKIAWLRFLTGAHSLS